MKTSHTNLFRSFICTTLLCMGLWLSLSSVSVAQELGNNQTPDLPSPICDSIEVSQSHKLMARVYAVGVQTYRWNGTSWVFVEPVATLYADANYHEKLGIHYAGPTWESNNGDKVVATRLYSCTPNPTAIPWLLLQTTSTEGTGPLSAVTFIQRVNTRGGLAPTAPGASTGVVAEVPYTTEYYFYRAKN
jgi:hypothetical protein